MPHLNNGYLPTTNMGWALYWAREFNLHVFPLAPGTKIPIKGSNGLKDATTDEATIRRMWMQYPDANIGARVDGLLVADVDPRDGGRAAGLPPTGWIHRTGGADGGEHHFYRLTADQLLRLSQAKQKDLQPGVNVRLHNRGYVVLPPSVHPDTGRHYALARVGIPGVLPDELFERLIGLTRVADPDGTGVVGAKVHSLLVDLLARKPARGEGTANNWLRDVCGHYARVYHGQKDLYLAHVQPLSVFDPPLDDATKTIESIWKAEHENHPERAQDNQRTEAIEAAEADNGWLAGTGRELVCPVRQKIGEEYTEVGEQWADFDLLALGVGERKVGQTEHRVWLVRLVPARTGQPIDRVIDSRTLADGKALAGWLGASGVTIAPPERNQVGRGAATARLLRYLEAQNPPMVTLASCLGWDDQAAGFLTYEGVITADGPREFDNVRLDPKLAESNAAPYRYGFEADAAEARRVLAEVLTHQDETLTSVFGALWAANLVKPQVLRRCSLFPQAGVQAASGAGKTNGAFAELTELSGLTRGEGQYTNASLRYALGANRSGWVWADDLDDPARMFEMVRAASGGGSIMKMGEDRSTVVDAELVGTLILSGEALAIGGQKALIERFVMLHADSPVNRMSVKPGRGHLPQWDDIVALNERYPDGLHALAGWYVQLALAELDQVDRALHRRWAEDGAGRPAEKALVLRVGAMLLDSLVGHPGAWEGQGEHYRRVAGWLADDANTGRTFDGDNRLTMEILPWALRAHGFPASPSAPGGGLGAFVEIDIDEEALDGGTPIVWFSPKRLAEVWSEYRHGRVDTRTETAESFIEQARQLVSAGADGASDGASDGPPRGVGPSDKKQWRTTKQGSGAKQYYWRLTGQVARTVLERAHGAAESGQSHGRLVVVS